MKLIKQIFNSFWGGIVIGFVISHLFLMSISLLTAVIASSNLTYDIMIEEFKIIKNHE